MPIYEFRCSKCSTITEKICSSGSKEIECPECGAKAEKTVSVFSSKTDSGSSFSGSCNPSSGFS